MSGQREWWIGLHHFRLEAPDVLWMKAHSTTSLEEAQRMVALLRELSAAQPLIFILDVRGATIDGEVRTLFAREMRPEWFQAHIYVGAGFLQKAIVKALAVALYFQSQWTRGIHFAESEAEAREFVGHLRAQPPRRA